MIRYTLQKARISFGESENSLFGFTKFTGYIELDGNFFSLSDAKIISEEFCEESCETHAEYLFSNGILWCWEVRTENNSLVLETSIRNVSLNDIRIGKWSVLQGKSSDSADFSLCNPEACRIFNWNPWYNDVLDLSGQGEISANSIVMFHISEMPSAYTFCGAFVTVDRMSCWTHFVYDKLHASFQRLDFCCDGSQYRLRPNQLLKAETLRLAYYKNQYEALDGWANELYQKYQPSFEGTCGVQLGSGVWNHTTEYDVQDLRDEICDFCDNQLS